MSDRIAGRSFKLFTSEPHETAGHLHSISEGRSFSPTWVGSFNGVQSNNPTIFGLEDPINGSSSPSRTGGRNKAKRRRSKPIHAITGGPPNRPSIVQRDNGASQRGMYVAEKMTPYEVIGKRQLILGNIHSTQSNLLQLLSANHFNPSRNEKESQPYINDQAHAIHIQGLLRQLDGHYRRLSTLDRYTPPAIKYDQHQAHSMQHAGLRESAVTHSPSLNASKMTMTKTSQEAINVLRQLNTTLSSNQKESIHQILNDIRENYTSFFKIIKRASDNKNFILISNVDVLNYIKQNFLTDFQRVGDFLRDDTSHSQRDKTLTI